MSSVPPAVTLTPPATAWMSYGVPPPKVTLFPATTVSIASSPNVYSPAVSLISKFRSALIVRSPRFVCTKAALSIVTSRPKIVRSPRTFASTPALTVTSLPPSVVPSTMCSLVPATTSPATVRWPLDRMSIPPPVLTAPSIARAPVFSTNTSPLTFAGPTVRFPITVLIASSSAPTSIAVTIVNTSAVTLFVEPLTSYTLPAAAMVTSSPSALTTPSPTWPSVVVSVMSPSAPATTFLAVRSADATAMSMSALPAAVVADSTSRSPPPLWVKSITPSVPLTAARSVLSCEVAFVATKLAA